MPALNTARARRSKDPFVQLGVAYLRQVRPLLTPAESKVYEELIIECDGWDRPTRSPDVARATGLHAETVRRAIRELARVGLVRRRWLSPPTSPHGLQAIEIVREYEAALSMLAARRARSSKHEGEEPIARADDNHLARRMTPDSADGSHLIARSFSRSNPDPSFLPSFHAASPAQLSDSTEGATQVGDATLGQEIGDRPGDPEGNRSPSVRVEEAGVRCLPPAAAAVPPPHPEAVEETAPEPTTCSGSGDAFSRERPAEVQHEQQPERRSVVPSAAGAITNPALSDSARPVPEELALLVRSLFGTDVAFKAARRYVGALLAIGAPPATVDEVSRYLKFSAKTERVKRARFPAAVACMPEEFADWLVRFRRLRVLPTTAPPGPSLRPIARALSTAELGERASDLCARLANLGRDSA